MTGHLGRQIHFSRVLSCLHTVCCCPLSLPGVNLNSLFPKTRFLRPIERWDSGLTQVVFASRRTLVCQEVHCLLSSFGQHDVSTNCPGILEFICVPLMISLNMRSSVFIIQILVCVLESKNLYNMIKRAIHFLLPRQDDKS